MKKKKQPPVLLQLEEEHLTALTCALEVYSRLRCGQVRMALSAAFYDKQLSWEELSALESVVKVLAFRGEDIIKHSGASYGVGKNPESFSATLAFEIKKVIDQYKHYQYNDGYRVISSVDGDGLLSSWSGVAKPAIVGFKPEKRFLIPKQHHARVEELQADKSNWDALWDYIHKIYKKKPLPRGNLIRIECVNTLWYVIVEAPYKLKND